MPQLSSSSGSRRVRVAGRALVAAASALLATSSAQAQSPDTVVHWHRVALTALAVPGANSPTVFPSRPLAMTSLAMFDAANTFDRTHQPFVTCVQPPDGASRDAAVAQAAHDVLVALLPSQQAAFDAALAITLAAVAPQAAADGIAVGAAIARATLAARADDGWQRPVQEYVLPGGPGYWRPTPPANVRAAFTHYPDVVGFVVPNGRRFLMEPPPALTSERYARDFEETRRLGAVDSTARTPEQTQVARLWHGVGTTTSFAAVWNQVVAEAARGRGWSGLETARAYALVNVTLHDALLTSFTGKFLYGFWRPVTAIREAGADGNDATVADPTWTPLLPTPPYPGHPGNMACLSAAQARVLERLAGRDDVPFAVTWTATAGGTDVTRSYNGFRQLADEGAISRVWGGIHFTFESQASVGACTLLGDHVAGNALRPRRASGPDRAGARDARPRTVLHCG